MRHDVQQSYRCDYFPITACPEAFYSFSGRAEEHTYLSPSFPRHRLAALHLPKPRLQPTLPHTSQTPGGRDSSESDSCLKIVRTKKERDTNDRLFYMFKRIERFECMGRSLP